MGEAASGYVQVRGEFPRESGSPGGGGVPADPQQVHPAGAMLDHERDVQPGQRDGAVDVEEVRREQGFGVGPQERSPTVIVLCRRTDPTDTQDLAPSIGSMSGRRGKACTRSSTSSTPLTSPRRPAISVLFPRKACREYTDRQACTGNIDGKGRHLLLMPQPLQEIQTRARVEQQTADWKRHYAIRAGCEATVSETVHAHGLRHCRYKDHPRPARRTSHLQQLCSRYFSS